MLQLRIYSFFHITAPISFVNFFLWRYISLVVPSTSISVFLQSAGNSIFPLTEHRCQVVLVHKNGVPHSRTSFLDADNSTRVNSKSIVLEFTQFFCHILDIPIRFVSSSFIYQLYILMYIIKRSTKCNILLLHDMPLT